MHINAVYGIMNTGSDGIPYSLNSVKEQELYKLHIDNVYDPSKFWVVLYIKERAVFQRYLTNFYKDTKMKIAYYHTKKYTSCIVSKDKKYYRAVILPAILNDMKKLRVFLVDYGQTVNVGFEDVFYIFKKHCSVPRFAMRASLADISPSDENEPWTLNDLQKFLEIISDGEILGQIKLIDKSQDILYLDLFRIKNNVQLCINSLMVQAGVGSYSKILENCNEITKYKREVKYIHLMPTFYSLEKGLVPCSLWEQNILKDVPLDLLYKHYYKFQNIRSHIQDCLLDLGIYNASSISLTNENDV